MSSKILILMRHAKPASDAAVEDFFIPLSKEGKAMQKKLCERLEKEGFSPSRVFASPFRRARETGEVVADYFKAKCIVEDALGEPFNEEVVRELVDTGITALVGHGPTLTSLANKLLGKEVFKDILPKSSAVVIDTSGTLLKYFH